jgi:hypothetical protein
MNRTVSFDILGVDNDVMNMRIVRSGRLLMMFGRRFERSGGLLVAYAWSHRHLYVGLRSSKALYQRHVCSV